MEKPTLLIDGDYLLKRGDKGAKNVFYKQKQKGALFNFVSTLRMLINKFKPGKVIVFWDSEGEKIRKELYPYYKQNRTGETKEELIEQRYRIYEYLEQLFIRQLESGKSEADDLIAYYTQVSNENCIIYTGDRDLCQLINERVKVYLPDKSILVDHENFIKHFNYPIDNAALVKTLLGCKTDNVFGIKGLGDTTLYKLLPEINNEVLSLDKVKKILNERIDSFTGKEKTTLNAILNGETKFGIMGESFFELNDKLVNLKNPILNEEQKEELDIIINGVIDPENRTYKNVIKMMMEDGIYNLIPKSGDGWIDYFQPFLIIMKQEKRKFENLK